jgi:hypothetical protein
MSVIAFVQNKDNISLDEVAKNALLVSSDPENTDTIRHVLTIKKSNIENILASKQKKFPRYINSGQYNFYNDYHPLNDDGGRKRIYTIFWEDNTDKDLIDQTAHMIGAVNFSFDNIRKKKDYFDAKKIKQTIVIILGIILVLYYLLKEF